MIITITLLRDTRSGNVLDATDLGYLLHKHPDRLQSAELPAGTAWVCYPEATPQRCTAALIVEIDPIALVRANRRSGGRSNDAGALAQYVNDRPYAASSLLSGAIVKLFRTAMSGRCDARPELAASLLPLIIEIPALPCRGGIDLAKRIFEPLGWTIAAQPIALDPTMPEWGDSRYVSIRLSGHVRLADALNQLYVLLPVLDDAKHYWVSTDEVDKLIRAGGGWLATHPEKELITRRYLRHRGSLTREALARLAEVDDLEPERVDDADAAPELSSDTGSTLAEQRRGAVLAAVRASGAKRVGDLGCGEGVLTAELLADRTIEHVLAADVSARSLKIAARRLRLETMPDAKRARISLIQSSLTYRDARLAGLDVAVLMEVIEHVDPERLGALETTVFGAAAPATVIVTTPNADYNVVFETLPAGSFRHRDHRFEWTRGEFASWSDRVAGAYGYRVRRIGVGPEHPEFGTPTQLAVFDR